MQTLIIIALLIGGAAVLALVTMAGCFVQALRHEADDAEMMDQKRQQNAERWNGQ